MIRLRYKKEEDKLVTDQITVGENNLSATIFTTTFPYKATIYMNSEEKVSTEDSSLAGIKKLVKSQLKELGVKFNDEVRLKRKELVP